MYYLRKLVAALVFISLFLGFSVRDMHFINIADAAAQHTEISDPLEGVNRAIYGFNKFLDKVLLKPIAKTYRFIVPEAGRKVVRNVLRNLTEPVTFVNSILQGDVENTFTTFWRFSLNSTFGLGGIFDFAEEAGLEHRPEDFGQTIGIYGAGNGPFLMIPVMGPSNTRDAFGAVADAFTDPFNYAHEDFVLGRTVAKGISAREDKLELIDEIERTSLDPYATLRSLYTQKRADDIANGSK